MSALFGTPIAARLFWFFNNRALGRRHPSLAFGAGAALTLAPFAVATWLQRELFAIAVLVMWPLGYGLTSSLTFPQRAARSWFVVVAVSLGVAFFLIQSEVALNVKGAVVPRPRVDEVAVAGNVSVVFGKDVDSRDAVAVADALDDAGFGKDAALRLRMLAETDGDALLRLLVPRGGDDVVNAGRTIAQVAADGLGTRRDGSCLRLRLVLPSAKEVANGRACARAR